ncbi:MAG: flavodoxin family protein [Acetobacteraceae bacterium]|nr:flavodoxin family protein [Acetobacteraceae bacterium]
MKPAGLVLGWSGSPRSGGNTDWLVGRVLESCREAGMAVRFLRLAELDLGRCRGCGSCREDRADDRRPASNRCVQEDALVTLVKELEGAEGLVVGSPNYCGTVTAQLKALIDRTDNCLVVRLLRGRGLQGSQPSDPPASGGSVGRSGRTARGAWA